jgi:carbon monoxide dehydrogenase subunit G
MNFSNTVTLQATPDELFAFVSDIERVAPCLPGATVDGRDGEDYKGSIKIRVGPVTAAYAGKLRFVELDAGARRAVMSARAEETNGSGGVEAQIVTAITPEGDGSRVQIDTELQISGRIAQLGHGAMNTISERMLSQFAANLQREISGGGSAVPAAEASAPAAGRAAGEIPATPATPVVRPAARAGELDALALVGGPLRDYARRTLAPAVAGGLIGALIGILLRRPWRRAA